MFFSLLLVKPCLTNTRQLCALLNAENVFRAIAEDLAFNGQLEEIVISDKDNPKFCAHAVKKINNILMTSSELSELRDKLKNGDGNVSQLM